jgi:hypothetical protein
MCHLSCISNNKWTKIQYLLEEAEAEAGPGRRTIKSDVVAVPNGIFIARGVSVFVSMSSGTYHRKKMSC